MALALLDWVLFSPWRATEALIFAEEAAFVLMAVILLVLRFAKHRAVYGGVWFVFAAYGLLQLFEVPLTSTVEPGFRNYFVAGNVQLRDFGDPSWSVFWSGQLLFLVLPLFVAFCASSLLHIRRIRSSEA